VSWTLKRQGAVAITLTGKDGQEEKHGGYENDLRRTDEDGERCGSSVGSWQGGALLAPGSS